MALFKQNKRLSDLPAPPVPDFQISKPNFEEDFPKYTPTISEFNNINEKRKPLTGLMPKKMISEETQDKKTEPIFIKIDRYEEALDYINSVRDKIKEIEDMIENLKKIKRDEDQALDEWKENLNQIKEKLMIVDRNLFES
jgi:predicted ribosome quality control (RQC) complex YloA/Tae2 family protein